jgi:predicted TIM-barrel fold metal-dependent hydrolase
MTTALPLATARQDLWTGPVIDVDVHANVPSIDALYPYMDGIWVDWAVERGYRGPSAAATHYPPMSPRSCRPEWKPDGRPPASSVELLQQHILDPWDVQHAILNCYYGVDSLRHPDWAAALAKAVNDWVANEWLARDPRLRASLIVPARDPAAMVAEIERIGDHPGFVQVLLPARNDWLWGMRVFHPVFKAIERHDLVAALNMGGTSDGAPSSTGYASYFIEQYVAEWASFASQITNIISEGVFNVWPNLRMSVLEGGFTWVPVWGWRMNKEWRGLHREVPWVDSPPLDIIREHMRFSTTPIDAGPPELMKKVVGWLGSDDFLMYSSDYPHGYDDDLPGLMSLLSEGARANMMAETARQWYRL